jgi:hypothetical protein
MEVFRMIEKIAYYQGHADEVPNVQLAAELAEKKDRHEIEEIAQGLGDQNDAIAADCLKVLYEVGYKDPSLIVPYTETFLSLLKSKNNRSVWGAAIALAQIAEYKQEYLFSELDTIIDIYRKGSVITVDNCIRIFASIAKGNKKYGERIFPILIQHLDSCRAKEIPQHAESIIRCIDKDNAQRFISTLEQRYSELTDAQKKRVGKISRRVEKILHNS